MISIRERYSLNYYAFLLQQCLALAIAFWSHNMVLVATFLIAHNVFAYLIPLKDPTNPQNSKEINKLSTVMGPCVVSCLMTPVILAIFWNNYEILIGDSWSNYFAGLVSLAFMIGGSIDAAHQLLHRQEKIFNIIGVCDLFFFQFTPYIIEHLYLHHKKVGSAEDPITSPKGQTFLSYYYKAISSAYTFNYSYSKKIFSACVVATLSYNLILVGLALKEGSGVGKILFFSLFSYVSLVLMEQIEYVEHYGLIYRSDTQCQPREICSWNTVHNQYLSWLIFRFQKHSDHHMNAHKPFSTLEMTKQMPKFPFDFGNAMILANLPYVWFSVADPLVDAVLANKEPSKENLDYANKVVTIQRIIVLALFVSTLVNHLASIY